jgi:hypothetical protein
MGYESRMSQVVREEARQQFKQDFAHFRSTLVNMPFLQRLRFCVGVMRGTV